MNISNQLSKKFAFNTIKLTDKQKEDKFLRMTDPNLLISLTPYILKETKSKFVTLPQLKKYYAIDWKLRMALLPMIRKIEDKLTGSFVQHIASTNPDFHLQSKNFNFNKLKGRNAIQHFKSVDSHVLKLRKFHNSMILSNKNVPKEGYILFEDFLSNSTLGTKIWTHVHSKQEFKDRIYGSFGVIKKHYFIFDAFLKEINKMRNIVSHHDAILTYKGKINGKDITLQQMITIISNLSSKDEREIASVVSDLIPSKNATKPAISKIYDYFITDSNL